MAGAVDLEHGSVLAGKYRVEHDLGAGGMGRVVAATHIVLRQRVAVKILTLHSSPDATRRFLREARLAVQLTSEHVAKVFDAGELESGVPFIAMELLDGVDLAKLLARRGVLPAHEACGYVAQACKGIAEAHALGMVHRDIKLANMFLARGQRGSVVKVLDFGCAKARPASATSVAFETEAGMAIGTPRWMAPEQLASARDVDARADVWALGVALYTMLAGRAPFEGRTLGALFEAIVNAPPPPIEPPLPRGLFAIIERCLRKQPDERFASARDLALALAPFTAAPRKSNAPKWIIGSLVALASMAAGATFVVMTSNRSHRTPVTTVTATATTSAAATPSSIATESAIAPTPTSSQTAPPRRVEATATIAATAPVAVPAPTSTAATPASTTKPTLEESFAAANMAESICRDEHMKACLTVSREVCEHELGEAIVACRGPDKSASQICTVKKAQARLGAHTVQSDACKNLWTSP